MIISWNTTKECNLYCKHCYRESGPEAKQNDELTTEEGKKMLDEIAKAGFKIMIFSGGEPLLRDDIYELVEHAASLGMRPVFGSNGMYITKEVAKKLKNAGTAGMGISLDSVDPKIHDEFRQFEGAWEKAVEGIKNCIEVGISVQINTTITDVNYDEFEEITDFVIDLGVKAHHPFFLVPTGRGKEIERDSVRAKRYHNMIDRILEKQQEVDIELKPTCAPQFMPAAKEKDMDMRFTRGCLAGTDYCCILPNGEVHICPYLPVEVGNVKDTPFDEIWEDAEIFNELRTMDYSGSCGSCGHTDICGGCRARAYYYSDGDYMAGEPWCHRGGCA
ncbi:putative heme d1 biosynthesis radical SAM protein NirJ2 [Selenihalanaerobacter shriftii]|uniref:Putative heme d1 biosynthesis radical SAM protein NirJ2 n=1 Tax=Selenihalanaerobacter shriftii TaxID=142842 RepID=A0A1T4MHR7_9FIRM|nr:putative heme d1 biosynthesis radical SAM protein NirJ2 [Selenihalanaerobacter shriftii]SJZ66415.1 putative heme d1 biosynthesis radical SAM protein NirJ2 [Selenihalanaerobacter shriftii]